jgi:hypothetical protein
MSEMENRILGYKYYFVKGSEANFIYFTAGIIMLESLRHIHPMYHVIWAWKQAFLNLSTCHSLILPYAIYLIDGKITKKFSLLH